MVKRPTKERVPNEGATDGRNPLRHHLKKPGNDGFPCKYQQTMACHGFLGGAKWILSIMSTGKLRICQTPLDVSYDIPLMDLLSILFCPVLPWHALSPFQLWVHQKCLPFEAVVTRISVLGERFPIGFAGGVSFSGSPIPHRFLLAILSSDISL